MSGNKLEADKFLFTQKLVLIHGHYNFETRFW